MQIKNDGFVFGNLRYFFGFWALLDIFIRMSNEYPVFIDSAEEAGVNFWVWICALSWIIFLGWLWHYLYETPKQYYYWHVVSGICNIACIDWAINSISVAFPYAEYIRITVPIIMLLSAILIKLKELYNQKEIESREEKILREIYKELCKLNITITHNAIQQEIKAINQDENEDK